MTRGLTTQQKVLIAAILMFLVAGAAMRLFLSYREQTRAQLDLKRVDEPVSHVVAHVKGAVNAPGIVLLPSGARVRDAVDAAGGFTEEADPDSVNLAATVSDGDEIIVFRAGSARYDSIEKLGEGETVNINEADAAEIQRVPGIGPTFAERIVELRLRRGPFASIDEVMLVQGIGEWRFEKIKKYLTVSDK